jgi:DNA-binding FrmR family transcriptional regulator
MKETCDKKTILQHVRRVCGQIQGIEKMIDEDRELAEVLQQITAADSSLRAVGKLLLLDYANGCFNAGKKLSKSELEKLIIHMFKNL